MRGDFADAERQPPPPASHSGARPELTALTGLRFIAAFCVFLFHIQIRWPFVHGRFLSNLIGQGAIGMSVFFVLSGFILAYQYTNANVTYASYFRNRLARIYPVYLAVALMTLPWLAVGGSSWIHAAGHFCLIVFANIFFLQAWFPQFFPLWNDGGSWSISVEMFCSVLLPTMIGLLVGLPRKAMILATLVIYGLAIMPGLVVIAFGDQQAAVFYSSPIYRLPEFLLGTCAFLLTRNIKINGGLMEMAVLALNAVAIAYLGFHGSDFPLYVTHDWIVLPGIVLAIAVLSASSGPLKKLIGSAPMVYAGRVSYCFYSFQLLLLIVLVQYHDRIVLHCPFLNDARIMLAASFAVLFAVSSAAHHVIEQPARVWLKTHGGRSRRG